MIPLFVGLTAFNLLCLATSAALGYGVSHYDPSWATYHQLVGAMSALACCAVHCIVFTYFIATAKWVQHAIDLRHLDRSLAAPTRSFKAQALPAAIIAMLIVFITAVAGVLRFSYGISVAWHHVLAIISLVVNGIVAVVEYRAIARNGQLIDGILEKVNGPALNS